MFRRLKHLNFAYLRATTMPLRLRLRKMIGRSHTASLKPVLQDRHNLLEGFERDYREFFQNREKWVAESAFPRPIEALPLEKLLPNLKTVLVLSPHPDDELIGCGGTILKLIEDGVKVTILQVTDGRATLALKGKAPQLQQTLRLQEARIVADFLGVGDLRLWSLSDGEFQVDDELTKKMQRLLEDIRPDAIFLPFINDPQPDHVKTNELLCKALKSISETGGISVLSYETWALVPANTFQVTTQYFEKKADALALYPIPMKVVDYISFCARRDAYHHWKTGNKFGFMENFLCLDGLSYIELVNKQKRRTE